MRSFAFSVFEPSANTVWTLLSCVSILVRQMSLPPFWTKAEARFFFECFGLECTPSAIGLIQRASSWSAAAALCLGRTVLCTALHVGRYAQCTYVLFFLFHASASQQVSVFFAAWTQTFPESSCFVYCLTRFQQNHVIGGITSLTSRCLSVCEKKHDYICFCVTHTLSYMMYLALQV